MQQYGKQPYQTGPPQAPVVVQPTVVRPCVDIKFYGAFVLILRVNIHAIDATPARWRGDAGSSPLDGASTAAPSPRNELVKNYRVHPTHWLISTQVQPTVVQPTVVQPTVVQPTVVQGAVVGTVVQGAVVQGEIQREY